MLEAYLRPYQVTMIVLGACCENNVRRSRQEVICKKGVLKNFAKFTGKDLCLSLFFDKRPATFKRLWHRCFLVNFAKF